jgi:hypothetical protein
LSQRDDLTGLTLVVVVGLGFQLFLSTGGIDNDGRFALNRTLVLTNTAPGALLFFDHRAFLVVAYNRLIRALLIADKADLIRVPGDAAALIDMRNSHLDQAFLFDGNRPDRFCGANPSAEIAEFLTVSNTGNKSRGIKTCKACLKKGGLERVVWTYFQTFTTPGANGDKFFLR